MNKLFQVKHKTFHTFTKKKKKKKNFEILVDSSKSYKNSELKRKTNW